MDVARYCGTILALFEFWVKLQVGEAVEAFLFFMENCSIFREATPLTSEARSDKIILNSRYNTSVIGGTFNRH